MRIPSFVAMIATVAVLGACDEKASCTEEQANAKMTELMTRIQEVGATDPAKLAALAPKAQELATKAQAGGGDVSEACKAIDEMLAELK